MDYSKLKIPTHIAIIVDGNGRWAKERGLTRSMGHKEGMENLERICNYALSKGIKYISLYVFSTENFKRSQDEVDYLMNLFVTKFSKEANSFHKKNIKLLFSGRREPLPQDVLDAMDQAREMTKDNTGGVINFCINYGGHSEIIDATKKIVKEVEEGKLNINDLNEETYAHYLYNDLPPVDFMIRTSGENRISNFLLWQLSYAEFYFPKTYFPAFTEEEFDKAIVEYTSRDRRFGGINYENKNN